MMTNYDLKSRPAGGARAPSTSRRKRTAIDPGGRFQGSTCRLRRWPVNPSPAWNPMAIIPIVVKAAMAHPNPRIDPSLPRRKRSHGCCSKPWCSPGKEIVSGLPSIEEYLGHALVLRRARGRSEPAHGNQPETRGPGFATLTAHLRQAKPFCAGPKRSDRVPSNSNDSGSPATRPPERTPKSSTPPSAQSPRAVYRAILETKAMIRSVNRPTRDLQSSSPTMGSHRHGERRDAITQQAPKSPPSVKGVIKTATHATTSTL